MVSESFNTWPLVSKELTKGSKKNYLSVQLKMWPLYMEKEGHWLKSFRRHTYPQVTIHSSSNIKSDNSIPSVISLLLLWYPNQLQSACSNR